MSDKPHTKLATIDREIRNLPIPGSQGMFDGTLLTIRFVRGFELFNSRAYHNYETWGDGYQLETHDGIKVAAEDLDDALQLLRRELEKRIVTNPAPRPPRES